MKRYLIILLFLAFSAPVFAQKMKVSGTVTDENGGPLVGVSVVDKSDARNATVTGVDGKYTISVFKDTFLEFSYPLMQGYDFYILNKDYNCEFQFGGQDQWGNMTAGTELTRRLANKTVNVATFPLLLKSDGTKFGKTAGGAVWLDPERTSPFNYYQFWRNTEDGEVKKLLALFTALPMDEVNRLGEHQPREGDSRLRGHRPRPRP